MGLFRGLQQCVCLGVCNSASVLGSSTVGLFRGLQQWVYLGVCEIASVVESATVGLSGGLHILTVCLQRRLGGPGKGERGRINCSSLPFNFPFYSTPFRSHFSPHCLTTMNSVAHGSVE